MGRKKKVVETPTETKPQYSVAVKQYIYDNFNTKSVEEIAKATELTVTEVEAIAVSSELDKRPFNPEEQKKEGLRRFATRDGTTMMTPEMSKIDDITREKETEAGKKAWFDKYKDCIAPIEIRKV